MENTHNEWKFYKYLQKGACDDGEVCYGVGCRYYEQPMHFI